MVKLSQKAWNNVIIVSMLLLIIMFNSSSNFLSSDTSADNMQYLLPQDSVVATLDFGDYQIERIGQGWRSVSIDSSQTRLNTLVQAWLSAQIEESPTNLSIGQAQQSQVVLVWLVGQTSPLKFELFDLANHTLVLSQQRLYELTQTPFTSLTLTGAPDA